MVKESMVGVRFTSEEKQFFVGLAEKRGLNISEFMRKAAFFYTEAMAAKTRQLQQEMAATGQQ
jgi:hypothetical protein